MRRKERQAVSVWEALIDKSTRRKSKLVEAEQLQRFLNDFRDLRWGREGREGGRERERERERMTLGT